MLSYLVALSLLSGPSHASSPLRSPVTRGDPAGTVTGTTWDPAFPCDEAVLQKLLSDYLGDLYDPSYPDVVAYYPFDATKKRFEPPSVCLLQDGRKVDILYDEPQLNVVVFSEAPMTSAGMDATAACAASTPEEIAKAKAAKDAAKEAKEAAEAAKKALEETTERIVTACSKPANRPPDEVCLAAAEQKYAAAKAAQEKLTYSPKASENTAPFGKVAIRLEGFQRAAATGLAPSNPGGGGLILPSDDPFRAAGVAPATQTEFTLVKLDADECGSLYRARAHFNLPAQSRLAVAIRPAVEESQGGQTTLVRFENVLRRWVGFGFGLGIPFQLWDIDPDVEAIGNLGDARFYLTAQVYPARWKFLRPRTNEKALAKQLLLNSALIGGVAIDGEFPVEPLNHVILGARFGVPSGRPWSHMGLFVAKQVRGAEGGTFVGGIDYAF